MENLKKIQRKIDLEKEILSAIPKKTKNDREEYVSRIQSARKTYEQLAERINQILTSRHQYYCNFKENPDIAETQKQINELMKKLILFNQHNSPYEKTGLDRLIYDIGKYYKSNFEKVTQDIEEVVEIFKQVGIELTKEDFVYSDYVKEYMIAFFEEKGNPHSKVLKQTFEKIYWQQPDIIKYIQYNFRYLYYQNETKFYDYVKLEQEKHIAEFGNEKEAIKTYSNMKDKLVNLINLDKCLILNKFATAEYKIEDYEEKKLKELYKQITVFSGDKKLLDNAIINLNDTLKEYKNYIDYRFLVDNVIEFYRHDEKTKVDSKAKLKEITNAENILIGKKAKLSISFGKKKQLNVDINKIQDLYTELDEIIFREKSKHFINEKSKIINAFNLAAAYYITTIKLIKKQYPDINQDKANEIYDGLRPFLLAQKNTIINNLDLFNEYDIPMIISDKYSLDNLDIDQEMLTSEKIDELIKTIRKITIAINLNKIEDLDISDINEFLELEKRIKLKAQKG